MDRLRGDKRRLDSRIHGSIAKADCSSRDSKERADCSYFYGTNNKEALSGKSLGNIWLMISPDISLANKSVIDV